MSLSEKTKQWLSDNCVKSLKGKTVLITGANSGVGYKTAETMLYLGADLIMACRNPQRAKSAKEALSRDYPDRKITLLTLDLADFSSIDAFVRRLQEERRDIDVFLNNAGVFHHRGEKTADGFELVIGTNYLGTYRLCEKILPYLQTLGHEVVLINTVSIVYKNASVDYRDFYYEKHYGDFRAYARSKLCLARYTYALAKRYRNSSIRVMMNHPGIALTPLGVNAYGKACKKLAGVFGGLFNSPEKSSLSVALILSRKWHSGSLVGPVRCFGGWGYPKLNRLSKKSKRGAKELIRFTESEIARVSGKES